MPQDDRKPNPRVSEFEKSQEMEVCKACGALHEFGERCPVCGITHEEYRNRFKKYGATSQ